MAHAQENTVKTIKFFYLNIKRLGKKVANAVALMLSVYLFVCVFVLAKMLE